MKHKYLNDIGINSNETCIFNTNEKSETKKRDKYFKKQRKKYGFDERETWSMDYTLATWLYSHLKAYKDYASIIDLEYHKLDIPKEVDSKEVIEVTQEKAINLMIENLEYYLTKDDEEIYDKYRYALQILAIVCPFLWW